jgi:glycosyltransferase involved in cell wall biosynthesis
MDLYFPQEHRFSVHDGRPVSRYQTYDGTWRDYGLLDVFSRLRLISRCSEAEDPQGFPADGPRVDVIRVPDYLGPLGYWKNRHRVRATVLANCPPEGAYLLRVPSQIATIAWSELVRRGQPYALEVVGDPYDTLAPGGVKHPLRPVLRHLLYRTLKRQAQGAVAAAYVTQKALQNRYPCPGPTWAISNITLHDEAIIDEPRTWRPDQEEFTLVQVGHLSYLYKAPHIIIDAVAQCVREGLKLKMVFIGEGQRMEWLRERAAGLGIVNHIEFKGGLPAGGPVRAVLDQSDLFLLPSFQEGLPRAMVEAMARALPCIGSTVGGIPELLAKEDLVRAGDVAGLAKKIRDFVTNPARMTATSKKNLDTAREYHASILRQRRVELCQVLLERTAQWHRKQGITVAPTERDRVLSPAATSI